MSRVKNQQPKIRILAILANHVEFEQYRMEKATGLSYPTILKHLKHLKNRKLINLSRTEPSEKGGKEKKIYAITLKGLWMYLGSLFLTSTTPEAKSQLEQIIKRFPDMLLFFKKWPLFVEAGVKDQMLNIFIAAIRDSWTHYYDVMRSFAFSHDKITKQLWKEITEALYKDTWDRLDTFVLVNVFLIPEMKEVLLPVYLKDQELSAFVLKKIERAEKEYKKIIDLKPEFLKGKG